MTDKQLIARLRGLVKSMYAHIESGCSDYEPWGFACDKCEHARHGSYTCAKFEGIKRRMKELGVDWEELQ
jgi:hypothetical protein